MIKSLKRLLKSSWRKLLVSTYILSTIVAPATSLTNIEVAYAADVHCVSAVATPGCFADLQTAINTAAAGDTINIEAGAFAPTSTLNVNKSLAIVGAGVDTTIIDASGYAGYGMNVTASNVSFSGFTFTGANHYGLKIAGLDNVSITNLKVTNSARTNVDFNGVDNVVVNGLVSTGVGFGTGLSITDGNNYSISNVTTSGNAWAGMAIYTSTFYVPAGSSNISISNYTFGEAVGLYSEVTTLGDSITNINVYPTFKFSVANSALPKVVTYSNSATADSAWFVPGNTVMDLSDNTQIYPDITAPSVPVLESPINGVYTNDNTPLMQWADSTDTFGISNYLYRIYLNCSDVDNPATCSVWPNTTGVSRPISEYQAGTTANGTFYWQVRAVDVNGNMSDWSELERFTIDTVAPAQVTLVSPANNSFVNGASLTNEWNSIADAASYIYESYNDEALTNVRWNQNVTGTSKTATNVAEATFWWRVRAVDAAGNMGPWSDAWKVTVDNTGPVAPVIVSPNEGDAYNSAPILNDWDEVTDQAGISKYRIQYAYDDGHTFSGYPFRETAGNVTQRNHMPATSEEGGVKFRVQAFDGAGNEGAWSEWRHYFYDLTAPITVFNSPTVGFATNEAFEVTGYTEDEVGVSKVMLYYSIAGDNNWVEIPTLGALDNLSGTPTFNWSFNWVPSADGTYDLMAKAYDTAGNLESTAYVYGIIYDTAQPAAAITAPVTGLLTKDGITVEGTASDSLSGVAKVEVRFRNLDTGVICKDENNKNLRLAAYDELTGTWSYDYYATQCPDGYYEVRAIVTDNAGNERRVWVYVTLDTTAPAQPTWGTIWNRTNNAEITCGGYTNTTQIKLDWNPNTETDLAGYWFGTKTNPKHRWVTGVDFYDGNMTPGNNPYYYTVIAVDNAGNESVISDQCGLILDQDAPTTPKFVNTAVLTRLGDLPYGGDVKTSMKFSESSDATTSVARYEYQFVRMNLDGVKLQSGSVANINSTLGGISCIAGICTWNPNTQNNSQWVFRLRSVDMAGNTSSWSNWDDATNAQFANLTATYADYQNGTGIFARADYNGSAGNESFIVRESVAPVSAITAPTGSYPTNNPNVTIEYSASDYGTEVKSVSLYNDSDTLIATSTTGEFDITLPYVDGSYCFYTVAEDVADDATRDLGVGNVEAAPIGKCELEVLLDVTAPVVGEVDFMIDFNPFLFGNGFMVMAPVSDSFSGVDISTCEFTFDNGATWEAGSYAMGNCVILKSTPDNTELTVNVRVMDNVGNSAMGTPKTRISDSANPTSSVVIDNVYSGPNVFNAMTIKGVAEDSTSNVEALMITIRRTNNNRYYNGSTFGCTFCMLPQMLPVSTATLPDWNYAGLNTSALTNGRTYVVTPMAMDSVGHMATGTADSFIWDSVAPVNPTGFTPTHDTPINVDSITVNWPTVGVPGSAFDALSGVKGYSVAWSMNAMDSADTTMDLDATQTSAVSGPVADGSWYLHIRTVDNVMNWSDSVAVGPYVVDTVAPVTTILGVDDEWHNESVEVTFDCTDVDGSGCQTTYYSVNGEDFVAGNAATVTEAGYNVVEFYSVDKAGNVEDTQTYEFVKIDLEAPTNPSEFNSEPLINISTQDNTVKVWWTIDEDTEDLPSEEFVSPMITMPETTGAYDELSGVNQFQYSFTMGETDLVEETDQLTSDPEAFSAPLSDGLWYFHMRTQDIAGNWSETVHYGPFVIDNTKPVITRIGGDVEITQGQVYADQGATAADLQDGNITTSVVVTNPVNTTVLGTYTVRYNVADSAGNVADEVTRTVTVVAAPIVPAAPVAPAVVPQGGDVQGAQDENQDEEEVPTDEGDVKGETCTEVKLFGYVYFDENKNDKFDKGEEVFADVEVVVKDSKGKVVETLETNEDGKWESSLCAGDYKVEVSKDSVENGYKLVKGAYDIELSDDDKELNVSFALVEQKSLLDYWWLILLALLLLVGGAYGYKKFRESK